MSGGSGGFKLQRVQGSAVTADEIVADMRLAAQKAMTTELSQRLYSQYGSFDPTTASRRFGSWNKAIAAAGLEVANEVNISDERLFENLLVLWQHNGRQPRISDLAATPSRISWGAYRRRFRTWIEALTAFVKYANSSDAMPLPISEGDGKQNTPRFPSLRVRFRVLQRDAFTCRACGASPATTLGVTLHVDHVVAWSNGGLTVEENLQTLCEGCNLGKSNVL